MSPRFFNESTSGLTALGAFAKKTSVTFIEFPGPGQEYIILMGEGREQEGTARMWHIVKNKQRVATHLS